MEIKNRPNPNEASHTGKTLLAQRLLEKYKNVAFAAILLFGACVFSAYSKNDDEKALGVNTTNRVDKYKDMESLVESQPFSKLQGVSVGNAQDNDAKTGVTVFFFPKASMASAVGCQHHRCLGLAGDGEGYCRCHSLQ